MQSSGVHGDEVGTGAFTNNCVDDSERDDDSVGDDGNGNGNGNGGGASKCEFTILLLL